MQGYGLDQDGAAFLTGSLTNSGLTVEVDSTENLGAGLAEIGDELVYIKSATGTTVTFAPDGRGYRGTTAAAHGVDARITMSPLVPRTLVKRKINETITGVYPTLWGTATTTLTYDPVVANYEVPTEVEDILQVTYKSVGADQSWPPVRRWRLDRHPDTTVFATGKSLAIWDGLGASSDVRVVYQKQPTELTNDADNLTTSGLASTARATIVAGAAWRLVSFMDASRLKVNSAVMDLMADRNPVGTATQIGSYLRKQYERELAEEQQRQQLSTTPVFHWQE
jgi:hypothetical protein